MSDEQYLRSLLWRPWAPGTSGKGVLLASGALRTWPTDEGGNVHHSPALALLAISADDVAAYIAIEPDGVVTVWAVAASGGADALVARTLAADTRLRRRPSDTEWDFSDA
jgi:hypothetical protein